MLYGKAGEEENNRAVQTACPNESTHTQKRYFLFGGKSGPFIDQEARQGRVLNMSMLFASELVASWQWCGYAETKMPC